MIIALFWALSIYIVFNYGKTIGAENAMDEAMKNIEPLLKIHNKQAMERLNNEK